MRIHLRGTIITMQTKSRLTGIAACVVTLSMVGTLPGLAQDANQSAPPAPPSATAPSGGWRKFTPADQAPPDQGAQGVQDAQGAPDPAPLPEPLDPALAGPQAGPQAAPPPNGPAPSPYAQQGPRAQPQYV